MKRSEKPLIMAEINEDLQSVGLPGMPIAILVELSLRDLHQLRDQWITVICGKYSALNDEE